jgi:hypothetical protein
MKLCMRHIAITAKVDAEQNQEEDILSRAQKKHGTGGLKMADLIVRDHAEQAIEAYLCSQCDRNGNRECIACPYLDGDEILKSVPAVNRWIPCSERLPKIGYSVLVTRITENGSKYVKIATLQEDCWMDNSDEYMKPNSHTVIAWMPMPDAFDEEDKELQNG